MLREATSADRDLLTELMVKAVNWTGEQRLTREAALTLPSLAHYVTGWPRAGDFGSVAEEDGEAVGAVWARTFADDDRGYGFVAADIPELSLGVLPAWRGQGVGSALLTEIIEQAAVLGHRAISLSVEDGNDRARGLYERHGFRVVAIGGDPVTMQLDLQAQN